MTSLARYFGLLVCVTFLFSSSPAMSAQNEQQDRSLDLKLALRALKNVAMQNAPKGVSVESAEVKGKQLVFSGHAMDNGQIASFIEKMETGAFPSASLVFNQHDDGSTNKFTIVVDIQ